MQYKEIEGWDIANNPEKVLIIITDNANHLNNDLYILSEGKYFSFDENSLDALKSLRDRIEKIIGKDK